jgi:Uma2 family endonuclease
MDHDLDQLLSHPGVTIPDQFPADWSLADLQRHLGGIPLDRVRLFPSPGYATEEHLVQIAEHEGRLYELYEGVLVEKPRGRRESLVAERARGALAGFVRPQGLGEVLGPHTLLRIGRGTVARPDAAVVGRDRGSPATADRGTARPVVPDLVLEVRTPAHTEQELATKRNRYFAAGVRAVWIVDPSRRHAVSQETSSPAAEIPGDGLLDGGDLLPGFRLSLEMLFAPAG